VKNVITIFPNSEDEKNEFGKPFSRHLKVNEVVSPIINADANSANTVALPSKKTLPELFVRFAPPGAALPATIKFQKRSEVETGWKLPDATPYVTENLKDIVAEVQRQYEMETAVDHARVNKTQLGGMETKKEKRKSSDEPKGGDHHQKKKKARRE
jgi:hypothetical protein